MLISKKTIFPEDKVIATVTKAIIAFVLLFALVSVASVAVAASRLPGKVNHDKNGKAVDRVYKGQYYIYQPKKVVFTQPIVDPKCKKSTEKKPCKIVGKAKTKFAFCNEVDAKIIYCEWQYRKGIKELGFNIDKSSRKATAA